MPVTLSFGNHHHYEINHSRLVRLMSSDKEEALYMGYGIDLRTTSEHKKTRGAGGIIYTHPRMWT